MQREYKLLVAGNYTAHGLEEKLNALARDGYYIVGSNHYYIFLERSASDAQEAKEGITDAE